MADIKRFQAMILAELANHSGNDIEQYDWVLELGAKPKFDRLCLSNSDSKSHILNQENKTLCGLHIAHKKEVIGCITYCRDCICTK